jgi:hypothetical protein
MSSLARSALPAAVPPSQAALKLDDIVPTHHLFQVSMRFPWLTTGTTRPRAIARRSELGGVAAQEVRGL